MKNAIIITPFYSFSYNVRIKYIKKYLENMGYSCLVITSNFEHRSKKTIEINVDDVIAIKVPAYKSNVSIKRIFSHIYFAKESKSLTQKYSPDLVYVSGPPNSLFAFFAMLKRKNKAMNLIFEIGDLWPEALPFSTLIKKFAFPINYIWASIRNYSLKYADIVIYECELFFRNLNEYHIPSRGEVIYLCKEDYFEGKFVPCFSDDILRLVYIGSVNNIVDMDLIISILIELKKKRDIHFTLIGAGEKYDELVYRCNSSGIEVLDCGIVYDDTEKYKLLKKCDFGLNIMKSNVAVGATMKSLEYFHWGIALINNIPEDTEKIVQDYNCGFNINNDNFEDIILNISNMSIKDIMDMKIMARKVYEQYFDEKVVAEKMYKILKSI